MVEKEIEHKESSGIALKLPRPSVAWMPDLLVLLPDGKLCLVEVKVQGKVPRLLATRSSE